MNSCQRVHAAERLGDVLDPDDRFNFTQVQTSWRR
jgi:hypothetical protein